MIDNLRRDLSDKFANIDEFNKLKKAMDKVLEHLKVLNDSNTNI